MDGTAEEHLRIGALEDAGDASFLGLFRRNTSRRETIFKVIYIT